jgi:hypothetical protein
MGTTPMDRAIRRLAAKQYGVFSAAQALLHGATRRIIQSRLAHEEWELVARGVYRLVGALRSWRQDLMVALLAAGDLAVVSHLSAAALWRLPGFAERRVEVLAPHGKLNHRMAGVTVHESRRLPANHVASVDGLRVTTIERTLCDVAAGIRVLRLGRAVDNATTRGLTTVERLWAVWVELAAPGRRGVGAMRTVLLARGPGYVVGTTELEARFLDLIRRFGLALPTSQIDLGAEGWVGRVDFLFRASRLVVEVDGRIGHVGHLDRAKDRERDNELMTAGWRVLRFTWDDLVHRDAWVADTLQRAFAVAA